jgi:hypothetical protein
MKKLKYLDVKIKILSYFLLISVINISFCGNKFMKFNSFLLIGNKNYNLSNTDLVNFSSNNTINSNTSSYNDNNIVNNDSGENKEKILINQKFCNFSNLVKNSLNNGNKTNSTCQFDNQISNVKSNCTNNQTEGIGNFSTTDSLISSINDQSEAIKKEICLHCLEISDALDILIIEIKQIKRNIIDITTVGNGGSNSSDTNSNSDTKINANSKYNSNKKDFYYNTIANSINSINLIKADLFKLSEIVTTLQKVNCPNFSENSTKLDLVVNSTNKLLEIIQESVKKLNLNINLVILT